MTENELIVSCANLLERTEDRLGTALPMRHPLLNVFWQIGPEAEELIASAYEHGWQDQAAALCKIQGQEYNAADAAELLEQMLGRRDAFRDFRSVWIIHYVDLNRVDLKLLLQRLADPIFLGAGITVDVMLCVFFKQTGASVAQSSERLSELWEFCRSRENLHLLLLSNMTSDGMLGGSALMENYLVAAQTMLTANSAVPLSPDLGFRLKNGKAFSACYNGSGKHTRDIARATLAQIIEEYQKQPRAYSDVRRVVCGDHSSYEALFQALFEQYVQPELPSQTDFLLALPYTEEVHRLNTELNRRGGGFLGIGKVSETIDPRLADNAVNSMGDIWHACITRYYRKAVEDWKSRGRNAIEAEFLSRIATLEITPELRTEARQLRDTNWQIIPSYRRQPLSSFLHTCACDTIRLEVYRYLASVLADTLDTVCGNGGALFRETLEELKNSLLAPLQDKQLEKAYRGHLHALAGNPEGKTVILGNISPCSADELRNQLYNTFSCVVRYDRDVYQADLLQDISFQAGNQMMNYTSLLQENLGSHRRISTFGSVQDGMSYLLLNPYFLGNDRVGTNLVPVPWKDKIEQLLIYSIDPQEIIF